MADITPSRYLNGVQAERFRQFFEGRVYQYETPFVRCNLPLVAFITRLKTNLAASAVFCKGGVVSRILEGRGTRLSDLDIQFEIAEPESWNKIDEILLSTLRLYTNCDCARSGGRKTRKLVKDGENSFAIHRLPTLMGGSPQDLDLTFHVRAQNRSFGSSDAVQIDLESLTDPSQEKDRIKLRAVDGYDVDKCLKLMRKHQFVVDPIERIGTIFNGLRGYCRSVSRGYYPKDQKIEEAFWKAFPKEDKQLLTYLASHYPADPQGQIIYCLNYYDILARRKAQCPDIEETLFQQISIALGVSARDYTAEERRTFFQYAPYYLYLRASKHIHLSERGNVFFAVDEKEGGIPGHNYLYVRFPFDPIDPTLLDSHPLLNSLRDLFPCGEQTLLEFLREKVEKPKEVAAPVLPLGELCKSGPILEIASRYQKEPDPSCLEVIAARSVPLFFELLELTPAFDAPFLAPLFKKYPAAALNFLLNSPPAIARKHLSEEWLKPLQEKFKEELFLSEDGVCLDAVQFCIRKSSPKDLLRLYRSLERKMIEDSKSLEFLSLFLPVLYPAQLKDLTPWLIVLRQAPIPMEILIHLAKHPKALASQPELKAMFQAQASTLIDPPGCIRDVLTHFKRADSIELALNNYPKEEETSLDEIALLRGLCKERQKPDRAIYLLHLHLLTLAVRKKRDQSINHELQELLRLLPLAFSQKAMMPKEIMESDLLSMISDRKEGVQAFKEICALSLRYCDDSLKPGISKQQDLIEPLFSLHQRLKGFRSASLSQKVWIDSLSSVMGTARKMAPIVQKESHWKPIKQKVFEMFCLVQQEILKGSEKPDPSVQALVEGRWQTADEFFRTLS